MRKSRKNLVKPPTHAQLHRDDIRVCLLIQHLDQLNIEWVHQQLLPFLHLKDLLNFRVCCHTLYQSCPLATFSRQIDQRFLALLNTRAKRISIVKKINTNVRALQLIASILSSTSIGFLIATILMDYDLPIDWRQISHTDYDPNNIPRITHFFSFPFYRKVPPLIMLITFSISAVLSFPLHIIPLLKQRNHLRDIRRVRTKRLELHTHARLSLQPPHDCDEATTPPAP
jgi:hypothetical protein